MMPASNDWSGAKKTTAKFDMQVCGDSLFCVRRLTMSQ
jgi:enolase